MPMAQGGQGFGMNINGALADATNYYVDGFNDRNPRGSAAGAAQYERHAGVQLRV